MASSTSSSLLIFTPRNPNLLQIKSPLHLSPSSSSSSSLCFQLSNPISSSFSQTSKKFKQLGFHKPIPPLRSSADDDGSYFSNDNDNDEQHVEQSESEYPKPTEIPWSKELANTVHLIGNVGAPIQFKTLDSGKVLAWTRFAVRKSPTETTWINLTFWDELAHTAVQHVEKGQQLYVSGRLVSDTYQGDDEKTQTYYKVVVKQINFIERGVFQDKNDNNAGQTVNYGVTTGASTQELWQAYFANPEVWWDNRKTKRTSRHPDFKHKDTGEALWVDAKYNPPWVRSQLAILDNKRESQETNDSYAPAQFLASDDLEFF